MKIKLNNKNEEFTGRHSLTVSELLELKNFTFKFLVVRVNDKTVKPGDFDTTTIKEGDDVKVIHLISGG